MNFVFFQSKQVGEAFKVVNRSTGLLDEILDFYPLMQFFKTQVTFIAVIGLDNKHRVFQYPRRFADIFRASWTNGHRKQPLIDCSKADKNLIDRVMKKDR